MEVAIIGGGLTGLAAAYKLCLNKENKIKIFEREKELGGMLQSYVVNNYSIEKYYHHIFADDYQTIDILRELSLIDKLKWKTAKSGYYICGKNYATNNPIDFLKFPNFRAYDFVKLAAFFFKIKFISDYKTLDKENAKEWIIKNSTKNIWENFFHPFLKSKFGKNSSDISAAWLVKRIKMRSNRNWNGEILGYLDSGFKTLVDEFERRIKNKNAEIYKNTSVRKIIIGKNKEIKGLKTENGRIFKTDKIIFTGCGNDLCKIVDENLNFPKIKYQGAVCVLLCSKKRLTEDIYWLNIKDKSIPFRAIIEHTNFISNKAYNNNHLIYLSYYFQNKEDYIFGMKPEDLVNLYFEKLENMFPNFNRNFINWWKIKKDLITAPIYEVGYARKTLPYKTNVKNLYIAGINSKNSYPDRSINGSIKTGIKVARDILE